MSGFNNRGKEAPMWPTARGGFYMARVTLSEEMVEYYRSFFNSKEAIGGQISVATVGSRAYDTSPFAYLKLTPASEAKEFISRKAQGGFSKPTPVQEITANSDDF